MAHGLTRLSFHVVVLTTLAQGAAAQSGTDDVTDLSVVEQITSPGDAPIEEEQCPPPAEGDEVKPSDRDATCTPQNSLLLEEETEETGPPVILKEDGAYLRLGPNESNDEDTPLELNPLAPSE